MAIPFMVGGLVFIPKIISYVALIEFSLPSEFYTSSFIGYGSFSVILAIVVPFII